MTDTPVPRKKRTPDAKKALCCLKGITLAQLRCEAIKADADTMRQIKQIKHDAIAARRDDIRVLIEAAVEAYVKKNLPAAT